jgi:RNA polymerase sigma factor (sigma-70 family)
MALAAEILPKSQTRRPSSRHYTLVTESHGPREDWFVAIGRQGAALRQLHVLFSVGTFGTLTDGQLLERFATDRGEASERAFAVLVERHGPMVLRACRALLRDEHEAQDAFQATFLVLVRRRGSLWVSDSLGPSLYGVAQRVASGARAAEVRRRRHERKAAEFATPRSVGDGVDGDVERSLHEEIDRLPERNRAPVVLCLLAGLTHEQAARHLGWLVGTVKSRLAHGRERLRSRLLRRGLAPGAVLSGATLAARPARAAMPEALVTATARLAVLQATGRTAAGAVPAAVVSLAVGVRRGRMMLKTCLVTFTVLTFGALGFSPAPPRRRPVSGVEYLFVDIQPKGNHRLVDDLGTLEGNNLAGVPRGEQKLGCTPFLIGERLIRVRGERSPNPPAAVEGIAVGARFDTLHILHSTMFGKGFGVDDGTEIGAYIVRYDDRTELRIPIIYGEDVRDWWRDSDDAEPSRGKVARSNKNRATGDESEVRLFSSEWRNPHPDKRVATIDFETKDTACAPFLVALTLERALYRTDDAADR